MLDGKAAVSIKAVDPLLLEVDATGMLPLPDAAVETEALLTEVVWEEGVL